MHLMTAVQWAVNGQNMADSISGPKNYCLILFKIDKREFLTKD